MSVINLDRPRRLRYGFKSLRLLREIYQGKDLAEILDVPIDDVPTLIWAGLIWEDPELKKEDVERMLDERIPDEMTVMDVVSLLTKTLMAQIGGKEEPKNLGAGQGPASNISETN